MSNVVAGEGKVFVCTACAKRSKDKYGDQAIDKGWDVSCTMNALLCYEDGLVIKDGCLIEGKIVE
jgi:hypothetical protein